MPGSQPAPPGAAAALRGVRGALLERLPLKITALFFAVVLWLAVGGDELVERRVPVRLALRADGALVPEDRLPALHATVTGRRRDLLKLGPGALVLRRAVAPGVGDSVQIVLRPGDVELPAGAERDLRVREVEPRVVTMRFARRVPETARARSAAP